MQVSRREAATIRRAVAAWRQAETIDAATAETLGASLEVIPFNWKALARYSFLTAIVCLVVAVSAAFASEAFIALIAVVLELPHLVRAALVALIAAGLYGYGMHMRARRPERIYSSEAVLFLGVLATAGSVAEIGAAFDTDSGNVAPLFVIALIVYAALGYLFRSQLIWVFALLSFGSFMGTETGYMSGWGAYYLGMNYPLRFVAFGAVLVAAGFEFARHPPLAFLSRTTLVVGLLDLFIALWLLSIFGNYGDMDTWYAARQIELFHWSLIFGAVAGGAIWHGLRYDDPVTRGFGVTFLGINLYTRFFEYFWEPMPKALFFAALAASFWFLGSRAETIWTVGQKKNAGKGDSDASPG
jgi:hypothetical protein